MQPVEFEHRSRCEKVAWVFVPKPSFVILDNAKRERSRLKSVIETECARVRSSESPGLGTGCHLGDFKNFVYPTCWHRILLPLHPHLGAEIGCFVLIDDRRYYPTQGSFRSRKVVTAARFLECLRNNL